MQTQTAIPAPTPKPALSASAYILLSFPLGILYFIFIIAGLALSAGLLPIFIGLPILLGVLTVAGGIASFERSLARGVLGIEGEPEAVASAEPAPDARFFSRLGRALTDPASYLHIAMLILKFPLGILNFIIAVTFMCTSLALIASPAVYLALERSIGVDIFATSLWLTELLPNVTSLQFSFGATAVGIVLLLISIRLVRGLAHWTARLTLTVAQAPRR